MKSPTLSAPSVSKSIINLFTNYFIKIMYYNSGTSRGFYSKFAACGLKFLEDIHWPVHSECFCLSSNNTVILDALGNDKAEKSKTNKGERNKGLGAGFCMNGVGSWHTRERDFGSLWLMTTTVRDWDRDKN